MYAPHHYDETVQQVYGSLDKLNADGISQYLSDNNLSVVSDMDLDCNSDVINLRAKNLDYTSEMQVVD
jgi:hypothetical protein